LQEFSSIITWKHLKSHGISTIDYKKKYGEVASPEYKELKKLQNSGKRNPNFNNKMSSESKDKISQSNKGNIPHNKNKSMSQKQKEILSAKAVERNIYWRETDSHPVKGTSRSMETKNKIKEKRATQVISKEQALKSIETKIKNGYNIAFFKGKTHSSESKEKISNSSKKTALLKKNNSIKDASARLADNGYTLISVIDNLLHIKCNLCNNKFTRSRQYATTSKITQEMCNVCYPLQTGTSNQEKELAEFLSKYVQIETNNRSIISPKELDIFIPNHSLAIEYNGLYWHSEVYKDNKYHLNKKLQAEDKGVDLIHIFEDEWVNNIDIVKSRLLMRLGKIENKIYARKCIIKEIDASTANTFIKQNHIQGVGRSNVRVGLYYNSQLVSVMTFLNGDISKGIKGWELNRFCSLINTQVTGAAGRLFKWFINNYDPETVISFSDRRWETSSSVYSKIGFKYASTSVPNYWYFCNNENQRYHRYSLRKPTGSILSERELRESQGYLRIYDCGSSKWIWSKTKAA